MTRAAETEQLILSIRRLLYSRTPHVYLAEIGHPAPIDNEFELMGSYVERSKST